jgi:photosystem II stability/assembly factor-like uncharacterized protein
VGPYRGFTKGFDNAGVLTVAPPPRFALVPNAIAFRDPRHGIMGTGWQSCAYTGFGCKPQGTISLTTNGGRTWTVLLRTPRPVVAVSVDGAHEQARFDDGETIGSGDGGLHWAPVVVPPTTGVGSPCPAGSQAFVVTAWAVCASQASAGSQAKLVFRLGVKGWKRLAAGGLSSYGYVAGLAMARNGFGLIWESRGTLYVTRDAGSHWTGLTHVAAPEVDFGASAVALPGGVGFVVLVRNGGSEVRRLVETTDAGRSWRVVHTWR